MSLGNILYIQDTPTPPTFRSQRNRQLGFLLFASIDGTKCRLDVHSSINSNYPGARHIDDTQYFGYVTRDVTYDLLPGPAATGTARIHHVGSGFLLATLVPCGCSARNSADRI